ncbi:MAG: endonuclease [Paludibacter sp.]|nr:endonuclease [Paludibacter sp.]
MQTKQLKSLVLLIVVLLQSTVLLAAVPSGYYYFVKNKKKAELKTALHTYCGPLKEFDYGGGPGFTWEGFFSTDRRADSTVIDMYSNTVRKQTSFNAVSGMHIEHSFPKSWWGAYPNNAYKDLFHLYPADASANESKNNLPLGEVTGIPGFDNGVTKVGSNGFETAYTDKCFEPADEYKGDFARSYFYISTIYENLAPLMQSPMTYTNNTYPFWKPWAIDLLLKWNKQDPVSTKELTRIEAVYALQGNRNPFIDYPDLAEYIWGKDTANVFPFPTETEPFLVAPRRGMNIDFGVILQNDSRTQNLHIQGVNLTSNLQISLIRNSATFLLSTPTISVANATNGIDLGITFQPTTSGVVRDTLFITGGGLLESLRIPIKALATADFITLEPTDITPVGGTLQWISDPLATNYHLKVYQGDIGAGDLFISAYVEGSSWNKAIELFNGTGKTVDLSKYYLQKQSNGAGAFGSTLRLTGTLDNGKTYTIVHKQAAADLLAKANLVTDSLLQYNGNDAIALVRSGVTIDMVGQANAGADVMWGVDLTLQRTQSVTHPISVFNPAEWTTLPIDSYSMLGSHNMVLTLGDPFILKDVYTGLKTSYVVDGLFPQNIFTYSIESMRSGVIAPAINTMQLHTAALDIPEISDPIDVQSKQFTANWGASPYASGYSLNVFNVAGHADTTEVEGFTNVGTSGTPLPTGWTGNASATYTSATSSGIAIPSINLKLNEWLQTKTYSQPVSKFTFMYRVASASTGSSIIVDGLSNNNWVRLDSIFYKNTLKTYPVYTFSKEQGMKAFRIKYNKVGSGNLAIDDVSATYGSQDTTYVKKNLAVVSDESLVSGLIPNSTYYYNVRATLGSATSAVSETMTVKTAVDTKLQTLSGGNVKLIATNNELKISGLVGNENIRIYSVTGICMYHGKTNSTSKSISLREQGVFILQIQNENYRFTGKFMK